jgi:Arc/MetJ-type ribon-helix-helix transcriptional regulator
MDDLKTTISLPPRIAEQIQEQIRQGWFSDLNSLVIEALRRYLETHSNEMIYHWISQDVEWGLSGDE